jgi:hypothetical protein
MLAPLVNKRNVVMAVRESEFEDLRLEDDLIGRLHAAREKNEVVERVDDLRRRSELCESHIRLPEDLAAGCHHLDVRSKKGLHRRDIMLPIPLRAALVDLLVDKVDGVEHRIKKGVVGVEVGSSLVEVAQQKLVPGISLDGCDVEGEKVMARAGWEAALDLQPLCLEAAALAEVLDHRVHLIQLGHERRPDLAKLDEVEEDQVELPGEGHRLRLQSLQIPPIRRGEPRKMERRQLKPLGSRRKKKILRVSSGLQ